MSVTSCSVACPSSSAFAVLLDKTTRIRDREYVSPKVKHTARVKGRESTKVEPMGGRRMI